MDKWKERKNLIPSMERDDYGRDRARIIHSAFFRRLQGKTQVLGLGESDFYRTRLTHSLEVAQIAGGIAEYFKEKYRKCYEYSELIPEQNLIEAIGLAHDIGHPPFGHGGEVALNYLMRDCGGFEGNAQTLRICTQLGEYSECDGLNLTRRALLGLIKYPVTYSQAVNKKIYNGQNTPLNIESFKPPKFNFFDCDTAYFEWILSPFDSKDIKLFKSFDVTDTHRKTKFKSFDATIMELADDIAYGVHDLEDAISLKLVTKDDWLDVVKPKIENSFNDYDGNVTNDLFSGTNKTRKKVISYLVHYFVRNSFIEERGIFKNKLLDFQATIPENVNAELKSLKDFVVEKVIKTPEVKTLEYKGQQMIIRLFNAIAHNPVMLEKKHYRKYQEQSRDEVRLRVICDYIAGDTDEYATRLYHKIFTPSSGSVFDRL